MIFTKTLEEDINKQISVGFTKEEIKQNLLLKGTTETEINEAFGKINFEQVATESSSGDGVSTKSILMGVLFVGITIFRFARFANGRNIFLGIGVITGIAMAVYFFTKKG